MAEFIGLIIILGLAVLALKLSQMAKAPAKASGIVSRPMVSENELEFFHRLERALPHYHIFPQVAANALLRVSPSVSRKRTHTVRNRFAQKHVDFLVCDRTTLQVKAIIDLDDRTHRAEKDKARDEMFSAAGYVTHRFESRRKPSEEELAKLFAQPVLGPETTSDAVTLDRQHTQTW